MIPINLIKCEYGDIIFNPRPLKLWFTGYQRAAFWTSGELYNWPANNNPAQASYVWDITGALVTYTNWCFGQPNNYGGNEQYIVVYNGCWFDTSGDGSQFTICEEIDSVAGATAAVRATDPLNKK